MYIKQQKLKQLKPNKDCSPSLFEESIPRPLPMIF